MPTVEENQTKIQGAQILSKLYADAGYWKIFQGAAWKELITLITPVGQSIFKILPFRITTVRAFFQREMIRILEGAGGHVFHMDDILVFGINRGEPDSHLRELLRRLHDAGVTLNAKKCAYAEREIKFMGQILNPKGISLHPGKTEAIMEMCSHQGSLGCAITMLLGHGT